jgi:D-alanyl-D-alanine carboxypeptidase
MPTTQEMRNMYRELVTGGVDSAWNVLPGGPNCSWGITRTITLLAGGSAYPSGRVNLRLHPTVAPWGEALAAVFHHHNYPFLETAGGSVSCRKITGGTKTSPHAHGVAIDINPSRNRYTTSILGGLIQWGKQTDMSPAMIRDAEAIRTTTGKPVTSWGGRWTNTKDPMHFEASKCLRGDLALGINKSTIAGWADYVAWRDGTQPEPPSEDDMTIEQYVAGLKNQPQQIDKLVDAGVIGIAPGQTAAQTKTFWRNLLASPSDPQWANFIVAVETESAIPRSYSGTFKPAG